MKLRATTLRLAQDLRLLAAEMLDARLAVPHGALHTVVLESAQRLEDHARAEAELADLRRVSTNLLGEHARLAAPHACLCGACRIAARWVEAPAAAPHPPFSPRCPLLARVAQEEARRG